jgi:hypothetical protein
MIRAPAIFIFTLENRKKDAKVINEEATVLAKCRKVEVKGAARQ